MDDAEIRCIRLEQIIFHGKRRINWDEVGKYLKNYQGKQYINCLYHDKIIVNWRFIDEFVGSDYTKGLRGNLAKTKANLAAILPQLIEFAYDKRWIPNKAEKHRNDASKGWYRYSVNFEMPVQAMNEDKVRWNRYSATLVIRWNDTGLYLYDVINIKKESSTPEELK